MKLIKITKLSELERLHDNGIIGNGTFSTGKFAAVRDDYDVANI